jgi:acyl-CoA thioesterase
VGLFDDQTAVERTGPDRYRAGLHRDWWVHRGPNGGYLAAVILRAMTDAVGDPERAPRSLTIHYTTSPDEDTVDVATAIERTGRSLTSCSARMTQRGEVVALAVGAFSRPRPGPEFCDLLVPDVPPPEAIPVREAPPDAPPIARRWDIRWAIGEPPWDGSGGDEAVGGGWIRIADAAVVDAPLVAAITDAWIPPVFGRIAEPMYVPTIDLTVHFRAALPVAGATPTDFVLARFRTSAAAEGFLEEDGEVWSADGRLLAQSRQLAAVVPLETPPT